MRALVVGVLVVLAGCRGEQAPGPGPAPAARRCLPVVAADCGCVYSCGAGIRQQGGRYRVTHPFWRGTVLTARIDRWCVDGRCTDAFFADVVCDGICPPRPADPTCHIDRAGRCTGSPAPASR